MFGRFVEFLTWFSRDAEKSSLFMAVFGTDTIVVTAK